MAKKVKINAGGLTDKFMKEVRNATKEPQPLANPGDNVFELSKLYKAMVGIRVIAEELGEGHNGVKETLAQAVLELKLEIVNELDRI